MTLYVRLWVNLSLVLSIQHTSEVFYSKNSGLQLTTVCGDQRWELPWGLLCFSSQICSYWFLKLKYTIRVSTNERMQNLFWLHPTTGYWKIQQYHSWAYTQKIQFIKHMKLKKKESVDIKIILKKGNKIPMEGVTETKFWLETEGMTIQRLPCLENPSHKQPPHQYTIADANKFCWQGPYIVVSWEALPLPCKYRSRCSQSSIGWIRVHNEGLEKVSKELKGFTAL